jgi:hypothetical protein
MVIVILGRSRAANAVARAVADELVRLDIRVAVIDLDILHDMVTADGPKSDAAAWNLARRAAATLTNTFLSDRVAVVIADGSFNLASDRAAFEQHLDRNVRPLLRDAQSHVRGGAQTGAG